MFKVKMFRKNQFGTRDEGKAEGKELENFRSTSYSNRFARILNKSEILLQILLQSNFS